MATPDTPSDDGPAEPEGTSAAAVRGPELAVAALLMLFGGLVIADSLRIGAGWSDDGPRAGYFPLGIGCLLLGSSGWIFLRTLLRWNALRAPFVMRHEFAGVLAVLWPTAVYIAAMPFTGLYVASVALVAWFMRRHGHYGWTVTLAVSIGVPVVFFLVFERWFLVPLPKGPLENALGF